MNGPRNSDAAEARQDALRLQTAADWVTRLGRDGESEETVIDWLAWCEADPRNRDAFDRAQSMWDLSGQLSESFVEDVLLSPHQDECRGDPPTTVCLRQGPARSLISWLAQLLRQPAFAVSLVGTGIAIAALVSVTRLPQAASPAQRLVSNSAPTAPAPLVRESRLSDGSEIKLATGSSIAVKFTATQRALELQRGEVFFSVASDKTRAFVVTAGAMQVRAVGTAFNVRRSGDRIVVTVAEGTVEVFRDAGDGNDHNAVSLSAGSQLRWGGPDENPVLSSIDPTLALAWQQGRLSYTDEPLQAVIADFNRYAQPPVRIEGQDIAHMRFTGTLFVNTAEIWLQALPRYFPIEIHNEGAGRVISRRSADSTKE